MNHTFNNIREFEQYFNKNMISAMKDVMLNDVGHIVKVVEQRNIVEEVYLKYTPDSPLRQPWIYKRRRQDGGLMDMRNMLATVTDVPNGVLLSVENLTRGYNQTMLLDTLIEYGDGYGGKEYDYKENRDDTAWQYLRARPFTKATIQELRETKGHVTAFRQGMEEYGIILDYK